MCFRQAIMPDSNQDDSIDAAWLGRLLPLFRMRPRRNLWRGRPRSDVMALYADTLVLGRSYNDPPVPEECATSDSMPALIELLGRKRVLPLSEITRFNVQRSTLGTRSCRCTVYSANERDASKLPTTKWNTW
jgi:hypothetical protein